MIKEEFLKRMEEDSSWAPGWEAIDGEFQRLYPGQTPVHYASASRAVFGGNSFLDGISIYHSSKYFLHLVTYGMSELYAEPDSLGGEWSKWGYEMTMKLQGEEPESCRWAMDLLGNLARYTYTQKRFLEPWQYIDLKGPICPGKNTAITALITVPDTEAETQDTLYGRLEFIQLVGITQEELQAIGGKRENIRRLAELLREREPNLVIDLERPPVITP